MAKHPNSMTAEERDRMRYRPAGAAAVRLKDGESVAYYGERRGHFYVYAYQGKAINTKCRYSFSSAEGMARYVEKFVASVNATRAGRAQRQQDRKAAGHTLTVGDILSCIWGYEQTNVDYYQVTRSTEKSVWVRPVAAQREQTQFMAGNCVPVPDRFIGAETGPHRASGESATCGYNGSTKVACVEVAGIKTYAQLGWSSYA